MSTEPIRTQGQHARYQDWCFTVNNYTPDEMTALKVMDPIHFDYMVFQQETGANGTHHLQGFIQFKKRHTLTAVKTFSGLTRAHLEPRKGSAHEAQKYCMKTDTRDEGTLPFERGRLVMRGKDLTQGPNQRQAREEKEREKHEWHDKVIKENCPLKDVPDHILRSNGWLQAVRAVRNNELGPWRKDLKVICIVGDTGCGKTYAAHLIGGLDMANWDGQWWWNAEYHSNYALVDEFYGNARWSELLKFTDQYPLKLPVKGGFEPAFFRTMFITSNVTPDKWYKEYLEADGSVHPKYLAQVRALWRRIGYDPDPAKCAPNYISTLGMPTLQARQHIRDRLLLLDPNWKQAFDADTQDTQQPPEPIPIEDQETEPITEQPPKKKKKKSEIIIDSDDDDVDPDERTLIGEGEAQYHDDIPSPGHPPDPFDWEDQINSFFPPY